MGKVMKGVTRGSVWESSKERGGGARINSRCFFHFSCICSRSVIMVWFSPPFQLFHHLGLGKRHFKSVKMLLTDSHFYL